MVFCGISFKYNTNNRNNKFSSMVGGDKMITILIAGIIALPIAWGVSKLYDYYTMKDVVFEMEMDLEEDEETDR